MEPGAVVLLEAASIHRYVSIVDAFRGILEGLQLRCVIESRNKAGNSIKGEIVQG